MLRAGAVLCAALILVGCTDTRSRRDGRATDAVRDRPGEQAPTDAVHEPRPAADRHRERGPAEAGLFACKASLGSASLQGTVQGKTISASNALAANQNLPQTAPAAILLASQAGSCAEVHAAEVVLRIGICQGAAGSYAIGQLCSNGSKAFARLPKGFVSNDEASFGTIIVEAFDGSCGGKSKGSFVLSFPDQGGPALLTGSFDTVGCGPLAMP